MGMTFCQRFSCSPYLGFLLSALGIINDEFKELYAFIKITFQFALDLFQAETQETIMVGDSLEAEVIKKSMYERIFHLSTRCWTFFSSEVFDINPKRNPLFLS
jgi:hypothetical protein